MSNHGDIIDEILKVPLCEGRRIIAIVGPPASGKSTLAAALQEQIAGSCVLPMDGFHLPNTTLEQRGLLARKGAPETFDVSGLKHLLQRVRKEQTIPFPTFDRAQDRSIPSGGRITPSHHTILVEGNYLLLDAPPWDGLHGFWDYSVLLQVDVPELERRLLARWLAHGHTTAQALARARQNDLPNAKVVLDQSIAADHTIGRA